MAWGSIAYKHGWVAITIQWAMCIGGLITGLYIAPKWKATGNLTAAEFIKERLGGKVQKRINRDVSEWKSFIRVLKTELIIRKSS